MRSSDQEQGKLTAELVVESSRATERLADKKKDDTQPQVCDKRRATASWRQGTHNAQTSTLGNQGDDVGAQRP